MPIYKKLLLFWIFLFSVLASVAQDTSDTSVLPKSFEIKYSEIGLKRKPSFYRDYKINIAQYEKLKKAGADLKEIESKTGYNTYKEAVLLSHNIIVGTVMKMDYDSSAYSYFHTIYLVLVEDNIKGIQHDTVKILLTSGPVGESVAYDSHEESEIFLGDKVILFLYDIPYTNLEEAKKQGLFRYDLTKYQKMSNAFGLRKMVKVHSNYVFDKRVRLGKLKEVKKTIRKIEKINSIDNPLY